MNPVVEISIFVFLLMMVAATLAPFLREREARQARPVRVHRSQPPVQARMDEGQGYLPPDIPHE